MYVATVYTLSYQSINKSINQCNKLIKQSINQCNQ
nr:MAG TPA: hypothetical protein [Caudoviricetes sp.]